MYRVIILLFISAIASAEQRIEIGRFSAGDLSGWENKSFAGETHYQLAELDGRLVLKAESRAAASGLYKKQRIDLLETPYLNWSWRIDERLAKLNEREKSGDDYAVRVYVVVSGGWAFWRTRAINYVWSASQEKGSVWPNAFAGDHAMMIALRDRDDELATWYREKRNVLEDLKQQFGGNIRYIDAVAIMTDTDNGGGQAESYYGDIFFSRN
ncbi:DUF3047 domain-containing protein [Methylomarinum vadi]|uniref:DUF3047 domain-containing protein n=1 Tax=Methylomarinum vadi TaxID=438855 RepID=UPI0004DF0DAB|nr:DUF3047 domain-containing protein [Methylomarinum vadi]